MDFFEPVSYKLGQIITIIDIIIMITVVHMIKIIVIIRWIDYSTGWQKHECKCTMLINNPHVIRKAASIKTH